MLNLDLSFGPLVLPEGIEACLMFQRKPGPPFLIFQCGYLQDTEGTRRIDIGPETEHSEEPLGIFGRTSDNKLRFVSGERKPDVDLVEGRNAYLLADKLGQREDLVVFLLGTPGSEKPPEMSNELELQICGRLSLAEHQIFVKRFTHLSALRDKMPHTGVQPNLQQVSKRPPAVIVLEDDDLEEFLLSLPKID